MIEAGCRSPEGFNHTALVFPSKTSVYPPFSLARIASTWTFPTSLKIRTDHLAKTQVCCSTTPSSDVSVQGTATHSLR